MSMEIKSTISGAIKDDHRAIEDSYHGVVNSSNLDDKERYGNQFVWDLARHSVAEELIVYPAFEDYLGSVGKDMADKDRKQHHKLKEHLKRFQNMKASDPEYIPQIKILFSDLSEHIKEEEEADLPALEDALAKAYTDATGRPAECASANMAATFEKTKHFVPTRAHPEAGENPAFESVLGLLAAPLDRLRDMLKKFPSK